MINDHNNSISKGAIYSIINSTNEFEYRDV